MSTLLANVAEELIWKTRQGCNVLVRHGRDPCEWRLLEIEVVCIKTAVECGGYE